MEFSELAVVLEKLESTRKRLESTDDLAKLFKQADKSELKPLTYLLSGRISPAFTGIELGVGDKLVEQAISLSSGKTVAEIEKSYRKTGDLGETGRIILEKKTQTTLSSHSLSVKKVFDNFLKLATTSGEGSQEAKVKLLAELLNNSSAVEGKHLIRFATGRLRTNVGEATIIDSFSTAVAGDKSVSKKIERMYNLTSDLGLVAKTLFENGIAAVEETTPIVFSPIRPALAERMPDSAQIIEKIGECIVEGKIDGFRLQIHKKGSEIKIFSRRQEPMTHMFPDLVKALNEQIKEKEVILEGEAIAFDERTCQFLSFQATIQRKRKHGIAEKTLDVPLRLFLFEALYLNGVDLTSEPYEKRRKTLEKIVEEEKNAGGAKTIGLAKAVYAKKPKDIDDFFEECINEGLEGVICKDLKAPYTAGARKFAWIKVKKSYSGSLQDTVDAVVIGYYFGKGKRTEFGFGGLLTAIYSPAERMFKSIARIGTGFNEEQMQFFSDTLSKIKLKGKPDDVDSLVEPDVWVEPKVVVEVVADEITKSPMHTAGKTKAGDGLALRFPRFIKVREDKTPEDATSEDEVLEMFEMQKQR
ncbi:ATP-dependent DNA ligase [Candidatus Micrarchaeota archaeon]|nr:ATP-dependent DNA ligase [Candidatus Micrarchaeota archaeon]